jgi:hypothetical protein
MGTITFLSATTALAFDVAADSWAARARTRERTAKNAQNRLTVIVLPPSAQVARVMLPRPKPPGTLIRCLAALAFDRQKK